LSSVRGQGEVRGSRPRHGCRPHRRWSGRPSPPPDIKLPEFYVRTFLHPFRHSSTWREALGAWFANEPFRVTVGDVLGFACGRSTLSSSSTTTARQPGRSTARCGRISRTRTQPRSQIAGAVVVDEHLRSLHADKVTRRTPAVRQSEQSMGAGTCHRGVSVTLVDSLKFRA